jgi:hypothetical protein
MTNSRTGKLMTLLTAMWSVGLFSLQQPVFAEGNCQEVKARFVDVYSGGATTSGTITQGGLLNGRTVTVFTSGAFSTPVATVVSFTGDLTITTDHGLLKTSNVYIYDFATGQGTAIGRINPNTSTGRFAGATGVLFLNETKTIGSSIPFTYQQDITGEICFAKE